MMSSPVSHGLLGLALFFGAVLPRGCLAQWGAALRRHWAFLLVTLLLAMSPDLDLIPGVLTGSPLTDAPIPAISTVTTARLEIFSFMTVMRPDFPAKNGTARKIAAAAVSFPMKAAYSRFLFV
ncbi:MAG: hypothetical protein EOM66_12230 [Clostridia bacterium]|nr:hypothetical protein [Clostridia bacterium]